MHGQSFMLLRLDFSKQPRHEKLIIAPATLCSHITSQHLFSSGGNIPHIMQTIFLLHQLYDRSGRGAKVSSH